MQTDQGGGTERPYIVTESGIYIDVSSVPALNDVEAEEFSQVLSVLKNKIFSDDVLHEVAVHEAGHIIQLALQEINRINLYGPTIRYKPESQNSRFFGFPAAVKEPKTAKQVTNDIDGVKLLTARCVSGGVATHIVFGRRFEDIEDEMSDDHDQFEKMCDSAISTAANSAHPITIDRRLLWSGMLKRVTTTYKSRHSIQTEILTVAEQVKEAIHRWRAKQPISMSCDLRPT